jgi:hypothetical protein
MYYLEEGLVLKNQQSLFEACDFLIHDGTDGVALELRRNPRLLHAFLGEIDAVHDGAVIFLKSSMMKDFFELAFPRLTMRFVLVTAGGDYSTPGQYCRHLDDQRIIRWFGCNCDLATSHPKFEPVPLGFADPHWPHGDQAAMMRVHRRMLPVTDKPLKAHASFHLNLSHPDRYGSGKSFAETLTSSLNHAASRRSCSGSITSVTLLRSARVATASTAIGLGRRCSCGASRSCGLRHSIRSTKAFRS